MPITKILLDAIPALETLLSGLPQAESVDPVIPDPDASPTPAHVLCDVRDVCDAHDASDYAAPRLLSCDLVMFEGLEVWYEFLAARLFDDGPCVDFTLRLIHEQALPPGLHVRMQIGPHVQTLMLNAQSSARWSLPLVQVQDAQTRRVQRPIMLTLSRQ